MDENLVKNESNGKYIIFGIVLLVIIGVFFASRLDLVGHVGNMNLTWDIFEIGDEPYAGAATAILVLAGTIIFLGFIVSVVIKPFLGIVEEENKYKREVKNERNND